MGQTPTTSNDTANTINKIIKGSGDVITNVAEALIIAEVPWLGWPIIKQIWTSLFEWFAHYFEQGAQLVATDAVIDVQIGRQESKVAKELKALIDAQRSGDANAIAKAKQDFANAISSLIHYDGDAPPK